MRAENLILCRMLALQKNNGLAFFPSRLRTGQVDMGKDKKRQRDDGSSSGDSSDSDRGKKKSKKDKKDRKKEVGGCSSRPHVEIP